MIANIILVRENPIYGGGIQGEPLNVITINYSVVSGLIEICFFFLDDIIEK